MKTVVKRLVAACVGALISFSAPAAVACSIHPMTAVQEHRYNLKLRRASKPVQVGEHCSFVNGGITDAFAAGPAIRLGKARFYQVLDSVDGMAVDVLVGDCNAREIIRVRSRVDYSQDYEELSSCGPVIGTRPPILKPQGSLTLLEGETLDDLVKIVEQTENIGALEELSGYGLEEGPGLIKDIRGKRVPKKDRFDLLCGCKLYYPDTAGAKS